MQHQDACVAAAAPLPLSPAADFAVVRLDMAASLPQKAAVCPVELRQVLAASSAATARRGPAHRHDRCARRACAVVRRLAGKSTAGPVYRSSPAEAAPRVGVLRGELAGLCPIFRRRCCEIAGISRHPWRCRRKDRVRLQKSARRCRRGRHRSGRGENRPATPSRRGRLRAFRAAAHAARHPDRAPDRRAVRLRLPRWSAG